MRLSPRERDRLEVFQAAELARRRRGRGLRLNHPEAVALIADEVMEAARDGLRYAEAEALGYSLLGPDDVIEGVDFAAQTRDGTYPLDVAIDAADRAPVVIDLPIRPTRCDPHAVQEDKRGTLFRVWVSLGGEPGDIEVYVGDDMRGRILTWVPTWCEAG